MTTFLHWNEKLETIALGSWHLANAERNGAACGYTPFYQRWVKTFTLKESDGVPRDFCVKCRALHDGYEVDYRMLNMDAPAPLPETHRLYEYTVADVREPKRPYIEVLAWCIAHVRWAHMQAHDTEPYVYGLDVREDGKWSYRVIEPNGAQHG